jgi:hypothetical protein
MREFSFPQGAVNPRLRDPLLKNLRSDPRYPAFLKNRNLPN